MPTTRKAAVTLTDGSVQEFSRPAMKITLEAGHLIGQWGYIVFAFAPGEWRGVAVEDVVTEAEG